MFTRRLFLLLVLRAALAPARAAGEMAGRALDFRIGEDFGEASARDIEALLRSAAETLWVHCPNTRWEVPGFFIYHLEKSPVVNYAHRADGRIAIGLNARDHHWAQFAFQFAHEFCHALAGHSNDWQALWIRGPKANLWLEESLCETASLFALRAMGRLWQTTPPYPNWRDFAKSLTSYAQDRLDEAAKMGSAVDGFGAWFKEEEPSLRQSGTQRDKNTVIASQLLPLFEAEPAGWEAITFCNLGERLPEKSLAAYFADWSASAPVAQRPFVARIATVFGVAIPG